jgi:predicted DCC family thiol-disulfide oxidoreductase YuxK
MSPSSGDPPPPPERPLLLYDGACGFCRRWVERWREATGPRVDYAPYQDHAHRYPQIAPERFERAVQLVETTGEVYEGAEAAFRALARAPGRGWMLAAYRRIPGAAPVAEAFYRLVARNRETASTATRLLWGKHLGRPTYDVSRTLVIRLMGVVYLAAFVSLWLQIEGLIGSRGILPVEGFLDAVRIQIGPERYRLLPTLCWLDSGDAFLHLQCAAGVLFSILLVAGVAPALDLILLWVLYLSLTTAGRVFMNYQWDVLLLEAGLLAVLFAPFGLRPARSPPLAGSRFVTFLFHWLLFRLLFSSGAVKLLSGDPTWSNLSALRYHYETQPLPAPTSWYAHQLPAWFHGASAFVMFAIELAVPFLVFAPRRPRLLAFFSIAALQLLIAATGNYGFFNLLTLVLCLLLVDDASWPERIRARLAGRPGAGTGRRWIVIPACALLLLLSAVQLAGTLRIGVPWPGPVRDLSRWTSSFRSVNRYGLFAVMTTTRPEIIVEGSRDGETWVPYAFRWKPGDPARRPRFVAPHQPRLDWQMWFAALGNYRQNPWLVAFLHRLLDGSPEVLDLLESNPFPEGPPRSVRAVLYEYRFTDPQTRRQEGTWWERRRLGLYCPVLSREPQEEEEPDGLRAALPAEPSARPEIGDPEGQHHESDQGVHRVERVVDVSEVASPHEPVLGEKEARGGGDPGGEDPAEVVEVGESGEDRGHAQMGGARHEQGAVVAQPRAHRAQAVPPVEVGVLAAVDDVEPRHPEHHGEPQQDREGLEAAADGDPGARRGDGQRRAQRVVRPDGEPLRVGIEVDDGEGDGREGEAERVEPPRGQDQEAGGDRHEKPDLPARENARGKMTVRRAGVGRVVPVVGQAVERHRRRAGAHHGHQDPEDGPRRG